jgi:hypothetical protein
VAEGSPEDAASPEHNDDDQMLDYAGPFTPNDRSDDASDELDGLRIRQLAALKRGAIRARSYALIGTVLAGVAVMKLVLMTIELVRARGWTLLPIAYILLACAALMLTVYLLRRAIKLHREANVPAPMPPTPPGGPDFSKLSDGSQQWKNLEDIR